MLATSSQTLRCLSAVSLRPASADVAPLLRGSVADPRPRLRRSRVSGLAGILMASLASRDGIA